MSDVTLVVGAEEKEIKAHKMMLATQSDYFKTLFYGSGAAQFVENETAKVRLPDHEVRYVQQLLEHLYTGEYSFGEEEICLDNHAHMICLGAYFQVESLRSMAMDRFAYWSNQQLEYLATTGWEENMTTNTNENYCTKLLDTVDLIWSNTSKKDRNSLMLPPMIDYLSWLLELKDKRFEKLTQSTPI